MILSFSTKFKNGKPTNFVGKIWSCIINELKPIKSMYLDNHEDLLVMKERAKYCLNAYETSKLHPKRHTIREDKHSRWKQGMKIHMVVFNRSKNQFQFAPVLECKSVQTIDVIYPTDYLNDIQVVVDGVRLSFKQTQQLAWNDGFESVAMFQQYFNTDFSGKIIHWTDLKY